MKYRKSLILIVIALFCIGLFINIYFKKSEQVIIDEELNNTIIENINKTEEEKHEEKIEEEEVCEKTQEMLETHLEEEIIKTTNEIKKEDPKKKTITLQEKKIETPQKEENTSSEDKAESIQIEEIKQQEIIYEEAEKEQIKEEKNECINNHAIESGNTNKWFDSYDSALNYYNNLIQKYSDEVHNGSITFEEYNSKCPYGYEIWSCPICGKWTLNFYYR